MNKKQLVKEISQKIDLPTDKVNSMLDVLTSIVYREAVNGFTLPGLCRFVVMKKKATRRWHPVLKKYILLKERNVLKITPLKKAKESITPRTDVSFEVLQEAGDKESSAPNEKKNAITYNAAAYSSQDTSPKIELGEIAKKIKEKFEKVQNLDDGTTVDNFGTKKDVSETSENRSLKSTKETFDVAFACPVCKNTVIADASNVGLLGECPYCMSQITIPDVSQVDQLATNEVAEEQSKKNVPIDRSSMTIRININDLNLNA